MTIEINFETLTSGKIQRLRAFDADEAMSNRQVMDLLVNSSEFRGVFCSALTRCEYAALAFETPALTKESMNSPFEAVLVKSTELERIRPNWRPFEAHITASKDPNVCWFQSLGKDGTLISPIPRDGADYAHLMLFMRNAPYSQVDRLWQQVGIETLNRLSSRPVWLSTAGMGVHWLHMRICDSPKYYKFKPYTFYA